MIKSSIKQSPSETRPKDKSSPIRPPASTDTSPNIEILKIKQKPTSKQKIQQSETINEFRLLDKMETESSPQLTKPKTQKNKPTKTAQSNGLIMNHQITR